jgi:hypothetical protein
VPHVLRHGTSVFKVISERTVILTSEYRVLSELAINAYFKCLRFDAAGVTERSDSRRIFTPGLFVTPGQYSTEKSDSLLRKIHGLGVIFLSVGCRKNYPVEK